MKHLKPRLDTRCLPWFCDNIETPEGRTYDHYDYPHIGAPGGPCDAFDDIRVGDIWLQWGSRLGKTFFGQCCTLLVAAEKPCTLMFASPTQKLAEEVVSRTYAMMDRCPKLRGQVLPPGERNRQRIDLDACRVWVGWSRSPSTLADKDVKIGHAGEIDKWEHASTAKEADPLKLFDDRFKNHTIFKRIKESTPSVRDASRIEQGRINSTNCRFFVPCPHCGKYQPLVMDRIEWDKLETGKSDKDLAGKTARYRCANEDCNEVIHDHHRANMMRRGVWCPQGCMVNDAKAAAMFEGDVSPVLRDDYEWKGWKHAEWIEGVPARDGTDAGYWLSSLYALTLSWGAIAAEWVGCHAKRQLLRNFINQWLAETWQNTRSKTLPEKLGERLERNLPRRIVPHDGLFISIGVDRQSADGGFFVYVVTAWGADERSWLIDWGECLSTTELLQNVLVKEYQHADGGYAVPASIAFIDSGAETKMIYDFCRDKRAIFPCKGMNQSAIEPYRIAHIGMGNSKANTDTAKSAIGQTLIHINTDYWETELQACLDDRNPGSEGSLTFVSGAGSDMDLCEQLLNGGPEDKVDARGFGRLLWVKKDENKPNDYRDALRYSMCAAKVWLDDRDGRLPVRSMAGQSTARPVVNAGESRRDGRPWI